MEDTACHAWLHPVNGSIYLHFPICAIFGLTVGTLHHLLTVDKRAVDSSEIGAEAVSRTCVSHQHAALVCDIMAMI